MNDDNEKNVFNLIQGNKVEVDKDALPVNEYRVTDIDGGAFYANGFLIFTTQHVAVMRDDGQGAAPVLILPLNRVAVAETIGA